MEATILSGMLILMEMPKRNASNQSPFVIPLMKNTTGTIINMNLISTQLTAFTPFVTAFEVIVAPETESIPFVDPDFANFSTTICAAGFAKSVSSSLTTEALETFPFETSISTITGPLRPSPVP